MCVAANTSHPAPTATPTTRVAHDAGVPARVATHPWTIHRCPAVEDAGRGDVVHAACMDAWARLFSLAVRQHGAVTRRQAHALGIAASTFDDRVRRELWQRPHPGVLLIPGTDPTSFTTRVGAALAAAAGGALATAWSGLYLHGVITRPPPFVTLVVPWTASRRRLRGVRTIRSRTLLEEDHTTVERLAVATPERTFVDTSRTDGHRRLRILLIDARQRRITEPSSTAARGLLHPGIPGVSQLVAAARDVDGRGVDSALSDVVHGRLVLAGLRPDPHPVPVPTPSGRVLHPDITFASARVCIECDSLGFHGTQRGLDLDHRKDQAYRQAGWNCLRTGWYRADTDWDGFEHDVRVALLG
jgi:hypothetical protein